MYEYPFGNSQQLNLDWFLSEWKNLLAAWEAEKNGIEGALQAEIDRAEAALADVFAARDAAAQSAANALESKNAAAQSASDASGYLSTVQQNATTAQNAAQSAAQSESNAADSAQTALASKNNAANSERNAAQSEANANSSKNAAAQSATDALANKNAAAQSAADALESRRAAAQSAEDARDAAASVEAGGASAIIKTIENVPVASFDDGTETAVKQIVVGIEPMQSGSGDPAPDNVRPITGWTRANVYRSGADTSNPTTISITFPDAAGTVYGGTLTNEGANEWKLVVDMAMLDLETINWGISTEHRFYNTGLIANFKRATTTEERNKGVVCSAYKPSSNLSYSDGQNDFSWLRAQSSMSFDLVIKNTRCTTPADFKAAMSGVQLVYELATPIVYSLTEYQALTLLNGVNNIWADTGSINLIKYIANSKQYIDEKDSLIKAIIAKELSSMIADTALVANDFRIVNNTLYKITGNIASGGTITPGTNCTATTITAVLKSLLS